jgi:hypothetical protein
MRCAVELIVGRSSRREVVSVSSDWVARLFRRPASSQTLSAHPSNSSQCGSFEHTLALLLSSMTAIGELLRSGGQSKAGCYRKCWVPAARATAAFNRRVALAQNPIASASKNARRVMQLMVGYLSRKLSDLYFSRGDSRYSMMRRDPVLISAVTAMPGDKSTRFSSICIWARSSEIRAA